MLGAGGGTAAALHLSEVALGAEAQGTVLKDLIRPTAADATCEVSHALGVTSMLHVIRS
jgi:hypothetical protein